MTLKIIEPTAMAPIMVSLPMWPTMDKSTNPSSGTVTFVTIDGTANLNISLSQLLIFICAYRETV